MRLLYQTHSYARQVLVLVYETGLADRLEVIHHETSPTRRNGPTRWLALRLQAVAHGIADAGGAVRQETDRRPAPYRYPAMRDGQIQKLVAAYDFLEQESGLDGPLDIGQIALATALSWIEFRNLPGFRDGHPRLESWYDSFARRPSMLATPLAGEVVD
jgi:glutathione S-transferase